MCGDMDFCDISNAFTIEHELLLLCLITMNSYVSSSLKSTLKDSGTSVFVSWGAKDNI